MSDGDGPGETGVGDRVAAAVEELYGADPQAFTERRGELAAAARSAGDREGAKAIGALRRPTRAAWVVNNLARSDPGAPAKLAELATALRAAQQAGHGPRLRELSAARGALVDALTNQAFSVAGVPDAPPSLRAEVTDTLTAAVADPEVAAGFASGTLTRAMQWSGFGVLPEAAAGGGPDEGAWPGLGLAAGSGEESADGEPGGVDGGPAIPRPRLGVVTGGRAAGGATTEAGTDEAAAGSRAVRPAAAGTTAGGARDRRTGGRRAAGTAQGDTAGGRQTAAAKGSAEAAARRQAEAAERLAQEAAERAARRREQYADAERLVASTAAAAADALANEDRLEAEVRDLEDRLTRTRADLAGMRMKARHAEAAERRARQALDRLPRE
ncbi:hypothetical protein EAS64_00655 [Trebonia kvetii]|uniref:Uncharacterized protein n=1 Tax=Trebonia kvetii TaxID=2480626 RepID=A0A6P2C483_9ACTN|nr:hypothetical protein [Trebonia kvetii]TVZ06018.1 hypothetical protein EAS64_00655 [Trebonia kvetii]